MPSTILSDNGVTSGSAGLKTTAASDGALALQTTTAGGAATTALTIDTSQRAAFVAGTAALPAITTTGDTNTGIWFPAADTIAFTEGGTESMRIDSSGNVGIGTSSPTTQLEIKSAAFTDSQITLDNTSSNTTSRVLFKAAGTEYGRVAGDATQVTLQAGNIPMVFRVNSAERMRIDSSGHVIVGYTASVGTAYQTNIQVKGGGASTYAAYGVITSNNESAGLFGAYSNGENSLWIASDPDNLRAGSRTVFTVDGTQTAQINPFGIGVGSATPTSGTGITFPATQSASSDANTLDDYEEGTFTPTIFGGTTAGSTTYTNQSGAYTKVGRVVYFIVDVNWSAQTGTGALYMGGLPFTANSTNGNLNYSSTNLTLGTNYFSSLAQVNANTTNINFYVTPLAGGALDVVSVDSSARIWISGFYFV